MFVTATLQKIARVAEKKKKLHLWYLSENIAALPLFSDDVIDGTRTKVHTSEPEVVHILTQPVGSTKRKWVWEKLGVRLRAYGLHLPARTCMVAVSATSSL